MAAVLATGSTATAAAAMTGSLPNSAQSAASKTAGLVGLHLPSPKGTKSPNSLSRSSRSGISTLTLINDLSRDELSVPTPQPGLALQQQMLPAGVYPESGTQSAAGPNDGVPSFNPGMSSYRPSGSSAPIPPGASTGGSAPVPRTTPQPPSSPPRTNPPPPPSPQTTPLPPPPPPDDGTDRPGKDTDGVNGGVYSMPETTH